MTRQVERRVRTMFAWIIAVLVVVGLLVGIAVGVTYLADQGYLGAVAAVTGAGGFGRVLGGIT